MSRLFLLAIRSLCPHGLCSRVHTPVLRKMRMPLLHHNKPRCAFTLTALTSINTDYDDVSTNFLHEPLGEVERFKNYRPGGYHPYKSEITFTVDIELLISSDMDLTQLRGWPAMNNSINMLPRKFA